MDVVPSYLDDDEIDDVLVQRVVDANGVSFYRFATEVTVDATTTYTFSEWKSIDTRYLKLTGGTVTGQTTFSGKLNASGETTFSGKFTASGETSVPTPSTENNSKTIANTEFVHGVVSNLVNGAPDALNTLQELATALGNDPNFSTTILNQIGEKESKTDAQIEHKKLQNAIDLCLASKAELGEGEPNRYEIRNIPTEKGMFPVRGTPDGFTLEDNKYPYSIVVNFQGLKGTTLLSLYAQDQHDELYFRIGYYDKWNDKWYKLVTTKMTDALERKIPTKVSQLTDDVGIAKMSNGHLVINGSELWIE